MRELTSTERLQSQRYSKKNMTKTIGYTRLKWEGIECIAWESYPIW